MTFRFRLASVAALAALTLSPPARALPPAPKLTQKATPKTPLNLRKFMPVSELKPGMRGYALTVFKGTKIEKFGVEILGVVSKFNQGKDYILFRATDGPPVTRGLNIAHGMSGSPIYVNGRLIGAISMGIPGTQFGRDPIALATPIEDMLDAWSPNLPTKPRTLSASPPNGAMKSDVLKSAGGFGNFETLSLPLTVSGMNAAGIARLQSSLAPYHFTVLAGGGGGASSSLNENPLARGATLQPGSAVGVSLIQGDIDLTATGTVTYREGSKLLIFGHPFTSLGAIDAPLTTAYVVDIYPSYQDSIKIAAPIKTVGRISQDRPFSVGGVVGPQPQMIPMTVTIDDQSLKRRKSFNVKIINHPLLTGQFVTQVADQAIAQIHGDPGDSMATVTLDLDVDEIGHVTRTNTFYDAVAIDQTAIGDIDSIVRLLSSNPFYPVAIKSVKMGVTIQNRHDTAEVQRIFVRQSKFAPGDTIDVGVVVKPFKRETATEMVKVKIPVDAPNGPLTLSVKGGGSDSGGMQSLLGGLISFRPAEPIGSAATVGQLVKQFVEKPRNNEIVARLLLPTQTISIDGEKLSNLPPTLASALVSARSTGLRAERDEVKVIAPTSYVLSGSQSLTILVQKKNLTEPPRAPSLGGSGPPPSSSAPAPVDAPDTTRTVTLTAPPSDPGDGGDDSSNDAVVSRLLSLIQAPPAPKLGGVGTSESPSSPLPSSPTPPELGAGGPPSPKPAPPTVKTVGRLPQVWRQDDMAEFAAGTLDGVSVTSKGDVRLSGALTRVAETRETSVWAILPDDRGDVYFGTGDRGMIYKLGADRKPTPFFETKELEVTSLAADSSGNLYAGTAPHGVIFKIDKSGKGEKFFTASEKYILALAMDEAHGKLYAATGGGTGRIYALPLTGIAPTKAFFTSPEAHLLALTLDKNGNVYAGSAPNGIVYKITPDGKASVLYDAPEANVSALAADASGNVYAGTMPRGIVYKITPDGFVNVLYDRASNGILSLKMSGDSTLVAVSGNTIYRIGTDDETTQSFVAATDEQFLSVAFDAATGQIYAGTGTVGALYTLGTPGPNGLTGTFQSTVHDAGLAAKWGTLTWDADTPPGTGVTLQTRTGDVARPDPSWSAWSPVYASPAGQAVTSPPGRYLQYQAVLTSDASAAGKSIVPRLHDVTVYYLTRNQPPTLRFVSPTGGDALSKTATLQWSASDPDRDTLTYEVSFSRDGGRTWTPVKKSAAATPAPAPTTAAAAVKPAATPSGPAPVTDKDVAARVVQMQAALDRRPDIPAAARAQLMSQAPTIARQMLERERGIVTANGGSGAGTGGDVKETSFVWDTTSVPDGVYQIQIVASDKISNPTGALTAKVVSPPFTVANTLPKVTLDKPQVGTDRTVLLRGRAATGIAFVKAVQYRLDNGDPIAAVADDGLFDSPSEAFTLLTPPLAPGPHTVELQVIDRAGNTATVKIAIGAK